MHRGWILAAALAACTDESPAHGRDVTSHVMHFELPANSPPKLDLLFVIDDTTAMAPYQTQLDKLPMLVETTARSFYGGVPDLRIGVTTNAGSLRTASMIDDAWIVDTPHFDGTRTVNYQGTLAAAVGALTAVGAASTATSQPLHAMKSAVDASAFVRADAGLVVFTITASDDASAQPVADYASWLRGNQVDPAQVVVSGLYPVGATRLDAFHDAFPNRSSRTPIGGDWAELFTLITQLEKFTLGAPCYQPPADLDPETPGAQIECSISSFLEFGERVLPMCNEPATNTPCWRFEIGHPWCQIPETNAWFEVEGFGGQYRPRIVGDCVVN